ncbi:hypothetical protein SAMN04244579_01410 [Azotobacter beijerinckii]|uniref:Lipoprotein n=1 Tax=Azotobacter beijerinckii TaxID=170623 RepID=A0A1H6S2F6_9GAMM|nr:hypothetical protein [Azotobacter beijerinckii]SEI62243.1 hypothetical protein SAMN04244579_01410 [Azotobacter beijerinckii]
MVNLRFLIVALMVALAGCATPERAPERPPPVVIPESTWRQIDSDIVAVSLDAKEQAMHFAHDAMQGWMDLVYQRTETDFIPWFSSYWTRQWLTMRVSWYKLSAGGEKDPTVERLALYLQEQYRERVLEPVAEEVDPDRVMEQTTKLYVWVLGELLQRIPQRYGIPRDQFDRRLKDIPAIALAPPSSHSASLYQIVCADPLARLPAYGALVARIHNPSAGAGTRPAGADISPVAKRTSENLVNELATSSVASVISTAVGRVAGAVISLGAAGFSAVVRENERPDMEAQLRKNLNAAFDEKWLDLMRNPDTGVLAGVYHISGRIEGGLAATVTPPLQSEPVPQGVPLPGEQPFHVESVTAKPLPGANE